MLSLQSGGHACHKIAQTLLWRLLRLMQRTMRCFLSIYRVMRRYIVHLQGEEQ